MPDMPNAGTHVSLDQNVVLGSAASATCLKCQFSGPTPDLSNQKPWAAAQKSVLTSPPVGLMIAKV